MSDPTDGLLRRRVRLGGIGLIVSGLLFLTTPFLVVGTITPPDEIRVITETSAVNSNTFEWRLGMAIAFVANAALVLGLFALYGHLSRTDQERWALAGLVVTVVTLYLYAPLLGVAAYVLPAVGALLESGTNDAITVLDRTWTDPFIVLPFLGGILRHVGVAIMGAAVWRSGTPSKRGGIALVISGVLGVPAFLDVVAVQYVSPVVLALGLILVGAGLWRSRVPRPRATTTWE